ncbi:MAG: 30S ribosomal protein S12 methylthiotransferase RimO [Proteobacteria bacterium]|nr:30S ribosomal protein S12 methylthiotransferase RimO [Desulfobacteraceae bacterium]MBU2522178.1 30S ribosomal protein S12 methylthiotransferase RimO [Pseudomonadota bacterium]MBU3980237.1 30S ribosomal protein S12 methylthiotransferase RimO [Pseudomonadota bacterium]MBU4014550.1 30S ribosomal protein S12 methylthiotransferase RimO [Pseudomonadota bacterium]MBU4068378.1 30S ribosomal protein S12 methylthiotransferase RimO [Pseudomonadota bacterium]
MKLNLVSLGCAKNLIDSEVMLGCLVDAGWDITDDPAEAEIIIVNTCSFIESAVNESIDTILELANFKETGACRKLIVTGCLPERFREEIVRTLPEVDIFLGTGAFDRIIYAVNGSSDLSKCLLPDPNLLTLQGKEAHRVRSSSHIAYIRIAEGCSRHCTYCIIPKLRGKYRSRNHSDIIAEARSLVLSGVKELIIIAQDTTNYGKDLNNSVDLSGLLESISDISEDVWIRFMYGHPESIDESIIKTIAKHDNICTYFDIPIQHAISSVLKRMGRKYTRDDLYRLFEKIRETAPDCALRTTAIVGFPGETDKDFEQLFDFVEDICFDHLGVFIYSDSEDLPSHRLSHHVPKNIAKKRYDRLMSRQADISMKNNQKYIGRVLKVLVEEKSEDNMFIGRTYFQAPEIDGITYINSNQLQPGIFTSIKISDAFEYDLAGKTV